MAPCKAIVKATCQPCKNNAREDHDTCACHRNYFDKEVWMGRFFSEGAQDFPLLGYGEETRNARIEAHFQETILSGRVQIAKEDVERIPDSESLIDGYVILCLLPTFNPLWNKRLLMRAIHHFLKLFLMGGLNNEIDREGWYSTRLRKIAENPNFSLGKMLHFFLKVKQKHDTYNQLAHLPLHENHFERAVACILDLARDGDYLAWYSNEYLEKVICHEGQEEFFRQVILPRLKAPKQRVMQARKHLEDPIKEQLVAWVYHPRNVENWLNTGGWDLVDMMF